MGLFKDLRTINRQAKAMRADWDPAAQREQMMARVQALNAAMGRTTELMQVSDDEVLQGEVQITGVGGAAGMLNADPLVHVSALVMVPGRPPVPAQTTVAVPTHSVHLLQAGAVLPARISPTDPTAFVVDWVRAAG